jgi:hypothetical protein
MLDELPDDPPQFLSWTANINPVVNRAAKTKSLGQKQPPLLVRQHEPQHRRVGGVLDGGLPDGLLENRYTKLRCSMIKTFSAFLSSPASCHAETETAMTEIALNYLRRRNSSTAPPNAASAKVDGSGMPTVKGSSPSKVVAGPGGKPSTIGTRIDWPVF